MNAPATFAQPHPLEALLQRFDRQAIGTAVEVLIAILDAADGDPDLEDATDLEDDFALSAMALDYAASGPGCSIADPDSAVDDSGCDGDADAEPDEREPCFYGLDQSRGPVPRRMAYQEPSALRPSNSHPQRMI